MPIRTATLDDTRAISALFCARVEKWQRLNSQGQVEDLSAEQLTIYERWLHGGAWLSVETGAIWLSHLLHGAGLPLILADDNEQVVGYAEVYTGDELPPFESHLHVAHFLVAPQAPTEDLWAGILERAGKAKKILAACSAFDTEQAAFYQFNGLAPIQRVQQINIGVQSGQSFYKASEHLDANPAQISGWGMPIGRTASARQHWEMLWASHWDAVPQIIAQRTYRLKINAAGQDAFVCFQERLYDPRTAEVYCWTPKALSQQLLSAIRDRAYRQGYRALSLAVTEKVAQFIGSDAETAPGLQDIWGRELT